MVGVDRMLALALLRAPCQKSEVENFSDAGNVDPAAHDADVQTLAQLPDVLRGVDDVVPAARRSSCRRSRWCRELSIPPSACH